MITYHVAYNPKLRFPCQLAVRFNGEIVALFTYEEGWQNVQYEVLGIAYGFEGISLFPLVNPEGEYR